MFSQATEIRRQLLEKVAKLLYEGKLMEKIDRIPLEMRPRGSAVTRCCIHKDRAVLKYKIMAILGFNIEDETDELTRLSDYAQMSWDRTDFTDKMLTVVDEACSSCVKFNYMVTNMCRACVGRPCTYACNKGAITVTNKAEIDHSKCISCGRCLQVCPYHAIVYTPVPCEDACPVGAISKNEFGVEHIDETKCIHCGLCKEACPYGAVMEKSYLVQIIKEILGDKKIIAMVAPAIAGQFTAPYPKVLEAIKQCGFDEVVEVALGANVTSANEAHEFEERVVEGGQPFMTTSCCPAYTTWAKKHNPNLTKYISDTKTPAAYTAEIVKKNNPDALTVFVGPCLAKRVEGYYDPNVDFVMTFEELEAMMKAKDIKIEECEDATLDPNIEKSGRQYARTTGVTASVALYAKNPDAIKLHVISGLSKENMRFLKSAAATGKCEANLIEVMMCEGGCVNGPDTIANSKVAIRQLIQLDKQ